MMLLTKAIRKTLPAIYTQEDKGGDAMAVVKLFTPDGCWTWFATEFDGEDSFFGLVVVDGEEKELGYFSLSELENIRGQLGLKVERDKWWTPETLREIAPEKFS